MALPMVKCPIVLATDVNKREPSTPSLTRKESHQLTDKTLAISVTQEPFFDAITQAAHTVALSRSRDH